MIRNTSIREMMLLLPALIIAFTIHELCHGLAAYALGDSTAKKDGRLSLNPIRHIDPLGLLFIMLVGFGWAKPVIINPANLKNPKVDMALIAFSGPLSNFIMAFLSLLIAYPLFILAPGLPMYVVNVIFTFARINIVLGIFNMLPVPPLDGSKVIAGLLPDSVYRSLPPAGNYGMLLLLILMLTGVTSTVIFPIINTVFEAFILIVVRFYDLLNII
ncbi:MAG: site-2 protease family protein [Defluviitaleaceae bacterium]|nr:site-2 protease family protein [Defluviitaleaceae bacterium]